MSLPIPVLAKVVTKGPLGLLIQTFVPFTIIISVVRRQDEDFGVQAT